MSLIVPYSTELDNKKIETSCTFQGSLNFWIVLVSILCISVGWLYHMCWQLVDTATLIYFSNLWGQD